MSESKRERIEWCDIQVSGADAAELPRVLLVGDSIARSYFPVAMSRLGEKCSCAQLATSKCVCDPGFIRELDLLLEDYRFAVIHFNNGLHGWDYDERTYARGLADVLEYLSNRSWGSKTIWASSTPVRVLENLHQFDPRTERVRERNRLAAEIVSALSIPINNLFDLVLDHPEYYSGDGVHFNPAGQDRLGEAVVDSILNTLLNNHHNLRGRP